VGDYESTNHEFILAADRRIRQTKSDPSGRNRASPLFRCPDAKPSLDILDFPDGRRLRSR
jgi:hypothetical protein